MKNKSISKLIETIDKQIDHLKHSRSELLRIVTEFEDMAESGPLRGTLKVRQKRVVNEMSLKAHVLSVLKKRKKGGTLDELKDLILAAGYKSNSANFKGVLYQCLYNTPGIAHDSESGKYTLTGE